MRALYSTYVSYLPPDRFTYTVPQHGDERGVFVEMLNLKLRSKEAKPLKLGQQLPPGIRE